MQLTLQNFPFQRKYLKLNEVYNTDMLHMLQVNYAIRQFLVHVPVNSKIIYKNSILISLKHINK